MSWLTENPWPLLLLLLGTAAVAALVLERRGRQAAVILLVLAVAVWLVADAVVTPSEVLKDELQVMLDGFKAGDIAAVHAQISPGAPGLQQTASEGLELVQLHSGFHLKDVRVTLQPDGQHAVVHLRANGRATLRKSNAEQQVATRWETAWELQSGRWKLTGVKRLDVVSGQEMGILDAG